MPLKKYKDVELQAIEDFREAKSKSDMKDADYLSFIAQDFDRAFNDHRDRRKEIDKLQILYENKEPFDFLDYARNDAVQRDKLFKSGIIPLIILRRCALMTNQRPKVYFNPIFKERALQTFMEELKANKFPEWVAPLVEVAGSPEVFFDIICDAYLNEWWNKSSFAMTLYKMIKDALISSKSWLKARVQDGQIKIDHIKHIYVCEDMDAPCDGDRRPPVYQVSVMSTRDIENMYGLKKGSIKGESEYSDKIPKKRKVNQRANFKPIPKTRVVEAYFTDLTRIDLTDSSELMLNESGDQVYDYEGAPIYETIPGKKGVPLYPRGRIITFICGQGDNENDIKVIQDYYNKYNGFVLQGYIPEPEDDINGRPILRDIAPEQLMADRAIQQGQANFETVGISKIFFVPNENFDEKKITQRCGEKIPVASTQDIQYAIGQPMVAEAIRMYEMAMQSAQIKSGINEAMQGQRPPNIESGEGIQQVRASGIATLAPSIRSLEYFLKNFFIVWGEMFLEVATKGASIRFGQQFYDKRTLPFDLSDYIEGFDIDIAEDSTMPKDDQYIAQLYMGLSGKQGEDGMPMVDRQSLLEALKIDRAPQIEARIKMALDKRINIEQLKQTIMQLSQQNQAMMKQLQKAGLQKEKLQGDLIKDTQKIKGALANTALKAQGATEREIQRQRGDIASTIIQGEIQKDVAHINADAQKDKPVAKSSK